MSPLCYVFIYCTMFWFYPACCVSISLSFCHYPPCFFSIYLLFLSLPPCLDAIFHVTYVYLCYILFYIYQLVFVSIRHVWLSSPWAVYIRYVKSPIATFVVICDMLPIHMVLSFLPLFIFSIFAIFYFIRHVLFLSLVLFLSTVHVWSTVYLSCFVSNRVVLYLPFLYFFTLDHTVLYVASIRHLFCTSAMGFVSIRHILSLSTMFCLNTPCVISDALWSLFGILCL